MLTSQYNQFCPIAMASEILEPRWTMLVLCEMWSGSTRFSEIQKGVPGMSPGLLSKRLRVLEAKGMISRQDNGAGGNIRYVTTPMADQLEPLINAVGAWAHANIDPEIPLGMLDHRLLMWNIRRKIKVAALPRRRTVVQFILHEPRRSDVSYWLIVKPDAETDLCSIDPQFDVDLYINAELKALTAAWMGHSTFESEISKGRIALIGDQAMSKSLSKWMIRSGYVNVRTSAAGCEAARQA